MFKACWAVGTAAMVAAVITFFPSLSPEVEASTPVTVGTGERMETNACTDRAWPYYAAECLRMPTAAGRAPARVIIIDRITLR
jgi:hypothetical protein